MTVKNTASGSTWSLSWNIDTDSIAEGNYKGLIITAEDSHTDTATASYVGEMIVDKTAPLGASITVNEAWSVNDREEVSIIANIDMGCPQSGIAGIEYKLTGAQSTTGFVEYTGKFNVVEEGITEITAREIDKAGNIGPETTKTVHIDRTNPEARPQAVNGSIFTNGKTNEAVDWTKADYTVDMTYADSVGLAKIYYEVTQSTTAPAAYDDYADENVSSGSDVKTVTKTIAINKEGENYIHYKVVDLAGQTVTGSYGPYRLDKTNPKVFEIKVEEILIRKLTIYGKTTDNTANSVVVSGVENGYDYSIDGVYNGIYEDDGRYTFIGLVPNKQYTVKMKAKDKAGNEVETAEILEFTKSEPSNQGNLAISVGGAPVHFINSIARVNAGGNVTNVQIDGNNVLEMLTNESNNTLSIGIQDNSNLSVAGLNGFDVKQMEIRDTILEVRNESASFALPAEQIDIDAVGKTFGEQIDLKDIQVEINIAKPKEEEISKLESAASNNGYTMIGNPVNFGIKCSYQGRTLEVEGFNKYAKGLIEIPEVKGFDKITTAVAFNADGSIHHVPTKVVNIGGKYFAQVNSLTNCSYVMVWNPHKFKDIENHWAKQVVNDMGSRMVIGGVGDNNFEPNRDVTRAEFATIMVRALGLGSKKGNTPFEDVLTSAWYSGNINTAVNYKLIAGYGNNSFGPMDKITREQAVAMVARAMKITELEEKLSATGAENIISSFKDADIVSDYAKNSVEICVKAGIISGREGGLIAPKKNITRAEAAVLFSRLLQKSDLI